VTLINVDGFDRLKGHYGAWPPHPRQSDNETPSLTERGAWKPLSSRKHAALLVKFVGATSWCFATFTPENIPTG
jgi:hypothetical protein